MKINLDQYDEILTPEEVANLLKLSIGSVYRLLETGELKGGKIASTWRIPKQSVLALFTEKECKAEGSASAEVNKSKDTVQKFVWRKVSDLLSCEDKNQRLIERLQDKQYCKDNLGIYYPLLLKVNNSIPLSSQGKDAKGRPRYWSKPKNGYFICSQLRQQDREKIEAWFAGHGI